MSTMRTIFLSVEFVGTAYVGWQSQANGLAVQDLQPEAIRFKAVVKRLNTQTRTLSINRFSGPNGI